MKKAKLFLSMILGDFEPVDIVSRAIDSVDKYVDGKYITVTYRHKKPSTSNDLIKYLTKVGANISYFKWTDKFVEAREFNLKQIPQGDDVFFLWLDADDVFDNAQKIPEIMSDMVEYGQDAVYLHYWYRVDTDENGNVIKVITDQKRERFVRNNGCFKWVGNLHELLIQQRDDLNIIYRDDARVIHFYSDEDSHREDRLERNTRILEKTLEEEKARDPRTRIYLAKAYLDKAKELWLEEKEDANRLFDLATKLFHLYLFGRGSQGDADYLSPSGWPEERSTAWGFIGEIAVLRGKFNIAIQAYQSGIDEDPKFPENYIGKASCYVYLGEIDKAEHFLNFATTLPEPNTAITTNPMDWKQRALEVSLQINLRKHRLKEALKDIEMMSEFFPDRKDLAERKRIIEDLIEINTVSTSYVFIGKYLEKSNKKTELESLVRSMPEEIKQERFASEMAHKFLPPREWDKNEITIMCGPSFEKWSPKSVETGIGGSEEAVINLSELLAKKGWKVTVFAAPGNDIGEYNGVTYREYHEFNTRDKFNILVLWRGIGLVDANLMSKFTMVWLHDVPNNPDFTTKRLGMVDKVAVLSEYHKSLLAQVDGDEVKAFPEEKVFLTANGISESINSYSWKGNPKKMIYSSSPDRGLVYLLKNWAAIKARVPDAELDVYYGFHVFDAIHKNNPERMSWKNAMMELMKQPGISYYGRIGHEALHQKITECGIWAYPTDFTEISCISGMKMQALGAIPVTTTIGALDETVKNGIKLDADITEEDAQKEYVDALVDMLNDDKKQAEIRKEMMPWARRQFSWEEVAQNWDELFRVNIEKHRR